MQQINFELKDYENFNDYNDLMVQAFGIGCSLCESPEIILVLKDGPIPIGRLIKQQYKTLTDQEVESLIEKPLQQWQKFDDQNSEILKPTFLCAECFNTLNIERK
ncbi:hypothetical protein CXP39_02415 [Mesoplasma syrphidae]|uniref:Uncharacterized protein n=1 Tax=Mesoplasma syrphidae TaxID=225999 RepID=A0A2K9CDB5_9MOLU|nr:hypothetical protein [Mesoplasma syrphidae]AUF83644.1 hypothetical protein CXP39_02415 [Mesoplasma syrphidae]